MGVVIVEEDPRLRAALIDLLAGTADLFVAAAVGTPADAHKLRGSGLDLSVAGCSASRTPPAATMRDTSRRRCPICSPRRRPSPPKPHTLNIDRVQVPRWPAGRCSD